MVQSTHSQKHLSAITKELCFVTDQTNMANKEDQSLLGLNHSSVELIQRPWILSDGTHVKKYLPKEKRREICLQGFCKDISNSWKILKLKRITKSKNIKSARSLRWKRFRNSKSKLPNREKKLRSWKQIKNFWLLRKFKMKDKMTFNQLIEILSRFLKLK